MKQPKILGKSIREINQIIKSTSHIDNDWGNFMLHFDKVHPDFFNHIKLRYPKITESESRLRPYIHIGLSTKEIAQILNVVTESIWQSRFRLRKNFNLDEDSLDDFIINSFST